MAILTGRVYSWDIKDFNIEKYLEGEPPFYGYKDQMSELI
jgi:hypothetical protein